MSAPEEAEKPSRTGSGEGHVQRSVHYGALVATLVFRIGAVVSFLLLGVFTNSFVVQTVVTLLLLALDFWTVKNFSGRRLVGLRWWNHVQLDGSNTLRFEFRPESELVSTAFERQVFWWSLYLAPVCWALLGVVCMLKFELNWLLVVFIAFILQASQLSAYWQCARVASRGTAWSAADSLGAAAYLTRQFERLGSMFKQTARGDQASANTNGRV